MIRYRISFLLLLHTNLIFISTEDAPRIPENHSAESKPPDKLILQKSKPYSESDNFIDNLSDWIKNPFESQSTEKKSDEDDLSASAAEHISARYLESPSRFRQNARNCYECNSEPWTPIAGRSLHFPPSPSHSNSLEETSHHNNQLYFKEKDNVNKHFNLYHPPIDQYGAPQATFDYPRTGEVVDFMLPPPFQLRNVLGNVGSLSGFPATTYGSPKPTYGAPKAVYGPPQSQYGPPRSIYSSRKPLYGPPIQNNQNIFDLGSSSQLHNLPTMAYRPRFNSKAPSFNYGPPLIDISPPPPITNYGPPTPSSNLHGTLPSLNYGSPSILSSSYGPPGISLNNYRFPSRQHAPTTHLRPVSHDFQPLLPGLGIQSLPLENNNPPPPVPSDSYGKPVSPTDSYGAPATRNHQQYVEPITLGSGDSDDYPYSKHSSFSTQNHFSSNFESQHNEQLKKSLYQKGLTDVQVVPSLRIADYTASIEHPIDVIQSPILDLNVQDQGINQGPSNDYGLLRSSNDQSNSYNNIDSSHDGLRYNPDKLSDNPIVVDDTYTSASNINTTYSLSENSTTTKRDNDKFLSSEAFRSHEDKLKEADLTTNLIQKLILEHNFIKDPQTQIVGIQKSVIDPKKVKTKLEVIQPSIDYSSWSPSNLNSVSTAMVPPKPSLDTWLFPLNGSYVTPKTSKKLQIIVPYLKAPDSYNIEWSQSSQMTTGLYNKEYTTLAPVFVPPPLSTESSNLWTKLVEDIRTVEAHRGQAQGFASSPTTEVYNIKEFLAKQNHRGASNLPYNVFSLQKNIDNWTHQSYANRVNFGDKLTTKLLHMKNIPQEYLITTPSYGESTISNELNGDDNIASSSNNKEYLGEEIEDNFISFEEATTSSPSTEKIIDSTTPASITYVVNKPKPSWEYDKVTFSNSTHEKVYVVTPQSYTKFLTSTPTTAFSMAPKIQNGKVNNVATMTRISVRVEAPSQKSDGKQLKPLKVVYSEWPHLINNLATITTHKPTSGHPLFGLMADLAAYTPPPNSTVETIGGHSKVTSVVTPSINKLASTTSIPSTNMKTVQISPSTE